jgi:hypothetical protein
MPHQALALQALLKAHNNALKRYKNAYAAAGPNLMAPCMGNVCLNFRQNRPPNQQRLRNNAMRARMNYNTAYNKLKKALEQAAWVNENNIYALNRPPNYMTRSNRWNLGERGRPIRAARTIQRHVRGTQQRARTGINNPYTSQGAATLVSRMMRNTGTSGRRVTAAQLNAAARRIQSAFRKRRARR